MSEQDKKPRREFNEQRARHALHSCLDVETSEQADELPALRECPFCGEGACMVSVGSTFLVRCRSGCGAAMRYFCSAVEAVAAWNRRADAR